MLKLVKRAGTAFILATTLAVSAVTAETGLSPHPYDIVIGIGSNASEIKFNWLSSSDRKAQVQLARTENVQHGKFPAKSLYTGTTEKVYATEGIQDNPGNTEKETGEFAGRVTVRGIQPAASYSYRVGDGKNWSSIYTFTTGIPSRGISFAVFGDPQMGASGNLEHDRAGWTQTLAIVTSKYPALDFLFSLGDQVNDYDSLTKQQEQYRIFINPDETRNYLQTHLLAAFEGNHDHQMGRYYSFHYNLPNLSTLGQTKNGTVDNGDGDYWFTYGPALFIILEGNNFYDTAAHDQFMKKAIKENPDIKWKLVAFHQAPYSEANHASANKPDDDVMFMRQNWTKLMDTYGIDVVLNGHDHYYTRSYQMYGGLPVDTAKTSAVTDPKGTVYITLDSGSGSKYYKYNSASDHSFSAVGWQNNQPTYSYVTITNSVFSIDTFETATGVAIDSYSITKTGK